MIFGFRVPACKSSKTLLSETFEMQLDCLGKSFAPMAFSVVSRSFKSDEEFSAWEQKGKAGPNKVDEGSRTVSGTANAFEISRSWIKLHLDGMNLEFFKQNPIVLAAHEQVSVNLMPGAIGTVESVSRGDGATKLRYRNMTFDTDPLSEAWFQKVSKGIVRMTSVGFLPIEWQVASEIQGTGKSKREVMFIDIPVSELVEISVVPIGANRGAMMGQLQHDLAERITRIEKLAADLQEKVAVANQTERAKAESALAKLTSAMNRFGR